MLARLLLFTLGRLPHRPRLPRLHELRLARPLAGRFALLRHGLRRERSDGLHCRPRHSLTFRITARPRPPHRLAPRRQLDDHRPRLERRARAVAQGRLGGLGGWLSAQQRTGLSATRGAARRHVRRGGHQQEEVGAASGREGVATTGTGRDKWS